MLPFVETAPERRAAWTRQALDETLASTQPGAQRWEAMLRHNHGCDLHDQGRYAEALEVFEANLPVTERAGNAAKTRVAHWMVAWTLRSLGRIDEALVIQQRLEHENDAGQSPDVYVYEELAHLHRAKGDAARAAHYDARRQALLGPSAPSA